VGLRVRRPEVIAPPLVPPPAATHVGTSTHVTAATPGSGDVVGDHARPPSVLRSRTAVWSARRAVARHQCCDPQVDDVNVSSPFGSTASRHCTPPSTERAADAPSGPVPTATQSDGFAHDAEVATSRAVGSVARCDHVAPLFVVENTAVAVVEVTSARQRPGPVQASAAMPVPGGRVVVVDDALCAGLTISATVPEGPAPPTRQPEDQQPAASRVAPRSDGVAAGAHTPRPPADTSIDAVPDDVVGSLPAAMHHASGSHARAERVTVESIAPKPVPSGGGAVPVVPHAARSVPASTSPTSPRTLTAADGRREAAGGRVYPPNVSWIDIVIIVWVALAALRGRSLGALTQLLSLVGFVAGLAIGAVVAVPIAGRLHADLARTVVTTCVVLGVAVLGAVGGNTLGKWANVTMRRLHLGTVDAVLGAAVAGLGALLSAWLVAGLFTQSSVGWLARPIQHSAVLTALDAVMPPVPSVIARAQAFVSNEVFPVAFAAVTQPATASVQLPTPAWTAQVAKGVAPSVLKVVASGGCGETRDATSFVVANGLVITNAHVVAGERTIDVVTATGPTKATLLVFDPALDVAVLRVPGLTAIPVVLNSAVVPRGTQGAVVGFPGGGPKTASPAGVAGALSAQGRDIYGGSLVTRPIYAVTATVLPGNSGSPLVGEGVLGMVFSRSLSQPGLAFALRASAFAGEVTRATHLTTAVGSGACTPG
jgi:uncharacterized membrane protein required for colicin V production